MSICSMSISITKTKTGFIFRNYENYDLGVLVLIIAKNKMGLRS